MHYSTISEYRNIFFTLLGEGIMIFPLEQLVKFTGNVYEITVASSRRAYQLAMMKDSEIDRNDGKVVSLAAKQVFNNVIQYKKIEQK